jgi:hypothetical protein
MAEARGYMAMLTTHASDRVFVSAVNTRGVIRFRMGPSERGPARVAEMTPSEARRVALFLLQVAEKVETTKTSTNHPRRAEIAAARL